MAYYEPDKPKFKRGETIIGVTTETIGGIGGKKLDFVVVGVVKDYYSTSGYGYDYYSTSGYGYVIKVCAVLFHGKSSYYDNLTKQVSLHKGWIEEVPYQLEIAEQVDRLVSDTPYLNLWKKLSGRKPKVRVKLI